MVKAPTSASTRALTGSFLPRGASEIGYVFWGCTKPQDKHATQFFFTLIHNNYETIQTKFEWLFMTNPEISEANIWGFLGDHMGPRL